MRLPICKCHGGGGGGGESKGGDSKEDSKSGLSEHTPKKSKSNPEELIFDEGLEKKDPSAQATEEQAVFDLERMMQLLLFNNDSGRGILTIRAKPGHSLDDEKEIQEFLQAIKVAFDQFKIALEKQGIPVDNFTAISNKNELVIRIPSSKYFDAFIQELAVKKLLPSDHAKQYDEKQNLATSPTPFAKTPSPSFSKKDDLDVTKPQSSLKNQITIPEPLVHHCMTPSPRAQGEGKNEGGYLEEERLSSLSPFSTTLRPKAMID